MKKILFVYLLLMMFVPLQINLTLAADLTFGYTTVGSSWGGGAGNLRASNFTLPEDGTVFSLSLYVNKDSNVKVAIYDDDGVPNNLKVSSNEQTCSANTWCEFNIPSTMLSTGTYWLAYVSDTSGIEQHDSRTGRGCERSQWLGYTNLIPDYFGSCNTFDNIISIFANYTTGIKLVRIFGYLKDTNNSPVRSNITIYNKSTSIAVNTTQTDTSGSYELTVSSGTYDVQYNILDLDFFISNFFVKLLSIDIASNIQNLANTITDYPSEQKVSFTTDISADQTIQIHSPTKPSRVSVNGTVLTEVTSLSDLVTNTWFYDSIEQKLHMIISPTIPTTTTTSTTTTSTTISTTMPTCGNGVQDAGEECGEPGLPDCPTDHVCANCKCVSSTLSRLHIEGNRIVNETGDTVYLRGAYTPNFVWGSGNPNLNTPEGRAALANKYSELGVPWVKIYFAFRYMDDPTHRANVIDLTNKLTERGIYVSFCFEPPEQDYYCSYSDYNYSGTGAHHDAKWNMIVDSYVNDTTVIYDWVEMIASDFKDNPGVWLIEPMTDVWLNHATTPVPYEHKGIIIEGPTTNEANEQANYYWKVIFDECVNRARAINPNIVLFTVNMGPDRMREPFISNPYPDGSDIGYSIHRFAHWDMGTYWYQLYNEGRYDEAKAELESYFLTRFIDFHNAGHIVANTEFGAYYGDPEWERIIIDEYDIYWTYGVPFQQHWFYGHDPTPSGFDLTYGDQLTLSEVGNVWVQYGVRAGS